MKIHSCRACGNVEGDIILDLGMQPACDLFPPLNSGIPDPRYPLQMWLCDSCELAQLVEDPTSPEEPRGIEPKVLVAQAESAIKVASEAGLLPAGGRVFEYGSPHGGSWLAPLANAGLTQAKEHELADVVVDCFGMMHQANQAMAIKERAAKLAKDGTLLIQYHSLGAILRHKQWNSLRHGHFGYYSLTSLTAMLHAVGLTPLKAWNFDLYGGTVLLAAGRTGQPERSYFDLLAWEQECGVASREAHSALQGFVTTTTRSLREWLENHAGKAVYGYGAASRTVTLLNEAGVDISLMPAIADASPDKQGRRIPGTKIPIISPADLISDNPPSVLLFLSDLLSEVQAALPALSGRWTTIEQVSPHSPPSQPTRSESQ